MNRIGPIQLFAEIKRRENRATYRGFDTESGQVVLVKIFTPAGIPSEAALAHFHQEAAIYASLNHPNIVRLVKFGVAEDRPYLALEFIEGQNLRTLLAQRSPLPNDIAAGIASALLAGLAEIHRHEIIHRDLKPENIMIGHEGGVKICDFDLALNRRENDAAVAKQLTGSPGYFAPEAILGEAITPRFDLFALGIMLYEMFTGARPFAAATASGEMNAIIRLPHLAPSKLNNAIPAKIEELINQLLAKSPLERPASAAGVLNQLPAHLQITDPARQAESLRRYLKDPPNYRSASSALPSPPGKPVARRSRNAWRIFAAAASTVLVAVMAYSYFFPQTTKQTNQQSASSGPRPAPEAVARPRADSILRVLGHVAALDNSPLRPAGPKIKEVKTAQTPVASAAAEVELPSPAPTHAIFVRNLPWAYLFVSGDSIGPMPRQEPLLLTEGIYQFVFKKPQFPPILFKVVVDASTADTLFFSLWERVAQVELKIHPWAEIFVDGARREFSAAAPTLYFLPGEHHFKFVHPQYGEKNEAIFLRAGEARRLEVNMFQGTKRE